MPQIVMFELMQEISSFNPAETHYDDFVVKQGAIGWLVATVHLMKSVVLWGCLLTRTMLSLFPRLVPRAFRRCPFSEGAGRNYLLS